MIKAIFSDLDGTLIENGVTSNYILNLIKNITSRGVLFSLVSGRKKDKVLDMPIFRFINGVLILEGGGIILKRNNKNMLLDEDWDKKIIKYKEKIDSLYKKLLSEGFIVHKKSRTFTIDYEAHLNINFTKFLPNDLKIEKNSKWLDVLPIISGKGEAVIHILKQLRMDRSEICAIGNDFNDISMLKIAGLPCTVADAPDEVKNLVIEKGGYVAKNKSVRGGSEILEFLMNKI